MTTLEIFQSPFDHTQVWTGFQEQAGLFRRVILDEAHYLRTSGGQPGTNIMLTGKFIGVGYFDFSETIARSLEGLKPDFK